MLKTLFASAVLSCFALSANAAVTVHSIGAPIEQNGMKIQPNYLTGVEMKGMGDMSMGGMSMDEIHLEVDVHATKAEAHGFPAGAWMPYLTVKYTLTKDGSAFKASGMLDAMTAKVGPHYAKEMKMAGPGTYQLTYEISPPAPQALMLHTDPDLGVPPWWKPFTLHWTFNYPATN